MKEVRQHSADPGEMAQKKHITMALSEREKDWKIPKGIQGIQSEVGLDIMSPCSS